MANQDERDLTKAEIAEIKENLNKENNKKKVKKKKETKSKILWYLIALGVIALFLLMLLSSVLGVGERLGKIHAYVEYGFYALVLLLVYFLLLRPVHIILFSPSFSVETALDKETPRNLKVYRSVSKRLIEQDILPEEMNKELKANLRNTKELKVVLNRAFHKHVKKELNKIIKKNAKTVMISTAVSQNDKLDLYAVIVVNTKMIKELVETCGFRPSMKNLSKLTINVFSTALIAQGLENVDLSQIIPSNKMGFLADVPFIKPIMSSVLQGVSNALLTLRIGIITRKFLFSDAKEITKDDIRKGAFFEAAKMLPSVVGDALMLFPKSIVGIFKKKNKEEDFE